MTNLNYVILCFVSAGLTKISAVRDAEQAAIYSKISECFSEYGLTEKELKIAHKTHIADNINPCFIACGFKKFDLIDNYGIFTLEKGLTTLKNYFNSEDITTLENIAKKCFKAVDDKALNDAKAVCERSKHAWLCFLKEDFLM